MEKVNEMKNLHHKDSWYYTQKFFFVLIYNIIRVGGMVWYICINDMEEMSVVHTTKATISMINRILW